MSISPKTSARCPMCRHPAHPDHAPFCSPRCRDRDMLNWLDGRYAVPVAPEEESALDSD